MPLTIILSVNIFAVVLFAVFSVFPIPIKFTYSLVSTLSIQLLFVGFGALTAYCYDGNTQFNNVVKHYQQQPVIATVQAPLANKPKSYKAVVSIDAVYKTISGKL
ncbi:MAG: hypothetical protein QM541_02715 [Flavobacterium sp.]|nr:hypothetical protein [Flavobacterium sp.]